MSWTVKLTDQRTDTVLVDLTNIALNTRLSVRLNRAAAVELTLPATEAALQATHSDGDFKLYPGTRAIKVYQDGWLRFHGTVVSCAYSGGTEWDQKVAVQALDPMFRLSTRAVWDSTGHIADPTFDDPINASEMIKQAIDNSMDSGFGDDVIINGRYPMIFPIETDTGEFSCTSNMHEYFTDGPQTIGDLVTTLTDTGQVDVVLRPVDTSMGFPAGVMAQLNVVPEWGITRSATFAYATGLKNVLAARRTLGIESLATRVTYELGPKIGKDRWQGNITATGPNIPPEYLEMSLAAREKFGVYHQVRVYDTNGDPSEPDTGDNSHRPLYMALWKTELLLRSSPRDLLYLTPAPVGDNFDVPRPFYDYDIGDIVNVQGHAVLGHPFAAQQRVYGFDVDINDMGVETVSELICSADAE